MKFLLTRTQTFVLELQSVGEEAQSLPTTPELKALLQILPVETDDFQVEVLSEDHGI